jgi:hypothetical protein
MAPTLTLVRVILVPVGLVAFVSPQLTCKKDAVRSPVSPFETEQTINPSMRKVQETSKVSIRGDRAFPSQFDLSA